MSNSPHLQRVDEHRADHAEETGDDRLVDEAVADGVADHADNDAGDHADQDFHRQGHERPLSFDSRSLGPPHENLSLRSAGSRWPPASGARRSPTANGQFAVSAQDRNLAAYVSP